jgi:hypothetical protein
MNGNSISFLFPFMFQESLNGISLELSKGIFGGPFARYDLIFLNSINMIFV